MDSALISSGAKFTWNIKIILKSHRISVREITQGEALERTNRKAFLNVGQHGMKASNPTPSIPNENLGLSGGGEGGRESARELAQGKALERRNSKAISSEE